MSFNTVIVDDQDARISYSGQWSLGGSDMNYRHSLFSSQDSSASVQFTFKGTSMILIGDVDGGASCNGTITLDGSNYTFASPVTDTNLHQAVLWTSPTLPDDSHSFTYSVGSCTNSSASLWFDYILYNSTSNSASDGATYFIDDDNANLQYTGSWERAGDDGDFMQTRQGGRVGSTVRLDFEGSSVSVFGRVDNFSSGIVSASFSVDGSPPVNFATSSQSSISYNKQLFQSRMLSPGLHSLVVTSNSINPTWIDYLLIQNGTSSARALTDSTSGGSSSASPGKVVGGVIGGISCIILVIVLANIWLKCWSRRQSESPLPTQRPDSIALELPYKPTKSLPPISTSIKNRAMDIETSSPRQRYPYSGAISGHSQTRVDLLARTPEFVSQDPFADLNSPQPASAATSIHRSPSLRSHFSESSVASQTLNSRHPSTIMTAETSVLRSGSTAPSTLSGTTASTPSHVRTVVNATDEHGYPKDLKKGNMFILTQDGMYSSSTSPMHGENGLSLNAVHQANPDEPPPMYSRIE